MCRSASSPRRRSRSGAAARAMPTSPRRSGCAAARDDAEDNRARERRGTSPQPAKSARAPIDVGEEQQRVESGHGDEKQHCAMPGTSITISAARDRLLSRSSTSRWRALGEGRAAPQRHHDRQQNVRSRRLRGHDLRRSSSKVSLPSAWICSSCTRTPRIAKKTKPANTCTPRQHVATAREIERRVAAGEARMGSRLGTTTEAADAVAAAASASLLAPPALAHEPCSSSLIANASRLASTGLHVRDRGHARQLASPPRGCASREDRAPLSARGRITRGSPQLDRSSPSRSSRITPRIVHDGCARPTRGEARREVRITRSAPARGRRPIACAPKLLGLASGTSCSVAT